MRFARVAIVVRTKDRPLMLRRAIDDILAQTYKDWLVVVVNDGGNVERLNATLDLFSSKMGGRLVVISNSISLGMEAASNMGIGACDSDFVAIHDDDDTWDPAFLSRTVADMDSRGPDSSVAGVVTWSHVIVEEIREGVEILEKDRFLFNDKLHTLSLVELGVENQFPPISFLFRRAAFGEVGKFREELEVLGDWDFHLRFLERFDIAVIAEPLARYHHRTDAAEGPYSNSVLSQKHLHDAKRIEIVNSVLRNGGKRGYPTIDQILVQGQFYRLLRNEQRDNIAALEDRLLEAERSLAQLANQLDGGKRIKKSGNLVENGDFRLWPGVGKVFEGQNSSQCIVCPGFLVSFDGTEATHQVKRIIADDRQGIRAGKSFLRVTNDGRAGTRGFFYLECPISDVAAIAGQMICVSGWARLQGPDQWASVGGQFYLPDSGTMRFPETKILLSEAFQPWSCTLRCPSPGQVDFASSFARVHVKLDYAKPFVFDLTDMQVEAGSGPTRFKYFAGKQRRSSSIVELPQILGDLTRKLIRRVTR
jgi:glycosyltransferase involved in cell wall biosynthesis